LSDIFQEVEEDLRRDKIAELWKKYGIQAIATFIIALLAASGVVAWKSYHQAAIGQASLKYQDVVQAGEGATPKAPEERLTALDRISSSLTPGYQVLARFSRAGALIEAHKTNDAVKLLDAIAADTGVDAALRDVARYKAALQIVESVPYSELKSRLAPLAKPESSFRFSADELLGYSALRAGDLSAARTHYQSILSDVTAPTDVRQRSQDMLDEIAHRLPLTLLPGAQSSPMAPAPPIVPPPAGSPPKPQQ
jgi:hypothetical protein